MTCEGAQASQGHPKEPCRDPRPSREGWGKGGGQWNPLPITTTPLCPQLLSSNSVRESTEGSPQNYKDLEKEVHIFIVSFSPAAFPTWVFFFLFLHLKNFF